MRQTSVQGVNTSSQGTKKTTTWVSGSELFMKCLNSGGPFHSKDRNLCGSMAVILQPRGLLFSLSLGFQKSSYLPPTTGSTSAIFVSQASRAVLPVKISNAP